MPNHVTATFNEASHICRGMNGCLPKVPNSIITLAHCGLGETWLDTGHGRNTNFTNLVLKPNEISCSKVEYSKSKNMVAEFVCLQLLSRKFHHSKFQFN